MKFIQPLLAIAFILTGLCIPLTARAATFDGLNIPTDFAGHLLATQKIQTNCRDGQRFLKAHNERPPIATASKSSAWPES